MKFKITLLTTAIIGIAIYLFQGAQVEELNRKQAELQRKLQTRASLASSKTEAGTSRFTRPKNDTSQRYGKLRATMIKRLKLRLKLEKENPEGNILSVQGNDKYGALSAEIRTELSDLTAEDLLQVIPSEPLYFKLVEDEVDVRHYFIGLTVHELAAINPKEGVLLFSEFAEEFRDTKKSRYTQWPVYAFRRWSIASPEEAYAWYQQQLAAGKPNLEPLKDVASKIQTFKNPRGELERILKIEDSQEREKARDAMIDYFFERADLSGHGRLLSALKLEQKKHPDSEFLSDSKMSYFVDLGEILVSEYFKTATQFVASKFTPGEKNTFAYNLQSNLHNVNISEPAKWASWISENGDQEACERFLLAWGKKDPEAVEIWLRTQSNGSLKAALSKIHQDQLAEKPSPFAEADAILPTVTIGE
ncbi:MAG: hypothetical protein ACSHYB_11170 [Roseibacillus sp.]